MKPDDLMHKASRAVASARLLFDAGDVDGACNRAAEIRLIADYAGGEVTAEKAQWLIQQAVLFVEAVRRELAPKGDPDVRKPGEP